ncbi:MAG TPA: FAD-dependent oxidoreductase [Polyangiaceae bacterium]|nr:FAD-dependent oxidoreductase [Polyangiaceae bacterium]
MLSSTCTDDPHRCGTAVLGGGPAGLSVAYHLRKLGGSSHIFEAGATLGGACQTKEFQGFRYDMGAHRLHNVFPEVTEEVRALLKDEIATVRAPSHIYHQGKPVPFPPSPQGLARALGFWKMAASVAPVLLSPPRRGDNFRDDAIAKYGRLAAESFLVNYSEKLWGLPAEQLAVAISGKRLQGLGLKSTLRSLVGLKQGEHLDGAFLYPKRGFGQITDALANRVDHVHMNARVEKLLHEGGEINAIVLSDGRRFDIQRAVSTLPIQALIHSLDPRPPRDILELASSLRFRSVRLAILIVDAASLSRSASLYFPCARVPFTRVYEPKQRSSAMAPADQTCLVLEYAVFPGDAIDSLSSEEFLALSRRSLASTGLLREAAVIGGTVDRVQDAYPVLDIDAARRLARVNAYLQRFTNLHRIGRAAHFRYSHFHDLMREGRLLAEQLAPLSRPSERGESVVSPSAVAWSA